MTKKMLTIHHSARKIAFVLLGLSLSVSTLHPQNRQPAIPKDPAIEAKIQKTLSKMSLDEKIGQMLELNLDIMGQYDTTGKWKLNEIMLEAIENFPPPSTKGKYIKIKYVTQLPTPTPVFAFFTNLPQYINEPYKRYLENQLRENFNLTGVPIVLVFRDK